MSNEHERKNQRDDKLDQEICLAMFKKQTWELDAGEALKFVNMSQKLVARLTTFLDKVEADAQIREVDNIPTHWETCYDNNEHKHYQKIPADYVEKRKMELRMQRLEHGKA